MTTTHPIHADFLKISDKELQLQSEELDLSAFGFKSSKENIPAHELRAIEHYKALGKVFVSFSQLDRLCFKHGLFWSEPENFVGSIPAANAMDILAFVGECEEEGIDLIGKEEMRKVWTTKNGTQIPISQMEDSHILNTVNKLGGYSLKGNQRFQFQDVHAEAARRGLISGSIYLDKFKEETTPALYVAATREFFKNPLSTKSAKTRYLTEPFGETVQHNLPKDDPIILAEVNEGLLVVTMWDESYLDFDKLSGQ